MPASRRPSSAFHTVKRCGTAARGHRPARLPRFYELDRHGREIVPVLRRVHEPLHARREEHGLHVVDQRHIGGVCHDLLVRLAIQLGRRLRVGLGDRLVQDFVDLRVVVPAGVEAVRRPRVTSRHDACPGRHRHAPADLADADRIGEAAAPIMHIGDPLRLLQLDVDADLLEVALDPGLHQSAGAVFREVVDGLEAVGVAGLDHQLLGLVRVVVVHAEAGVIGPGARRQHAVLGLSGAAIDVARDAFAVDGHVDGLPHADVLHRLLLHIEIEEVDVGHVLVRGEDEAVLHQPLDVVPHRRVDHVDLAGPERVAAGRRVLQRAEHDAVELGLAAPVVVVARNDGLHALLALDELEGAGADRIEGDAVIAELLHGGRAQHQRLAVALQPGPQPLIIRLGQRDLDGHGSQDFDVLDPFRVGADESLRLREEGRRLLVPEAVEIKLRRRRVEGRAVVELDAFAQLEGVLNAVVGDLP